jgi:anti-anti-sigma regulatory factor
MEGSPMLKITLHDSAAEFRLKLEGRLSGPWVQELEQCWKTASSTTQDRKTVLDLGEVDFVDPAGESLLARMNADGVALVAVTPLIRSLVEQICRVSPCGRVGKVGSTP